MKLIVFLVIIGSMHCISTSYGAEDMSVEQRFRKLLRYDWEETFYDPFTESWQTYWFLDGEKATLVQSHEGLDFWAGPDAWDDESHAVLWTRQCYAGDLKIEFEYTRLDSAIKFVNIIFIQATGSGLPGYDKDIIKWKDRRSTPAMSKYFLNMNTLHISYAAYGTQNKDPNLDYVRARRYLPSLKGLRGSELEPDYSETGLFDSNIPHKITIIKKDQDLFMHVKNPENETVFHWKNEKFPPIHEGRIGLRHMYTRGARYNNFRIFKLKN